MRYIYTTLLVLAMLVISYQKSFGQQTQTDSLLATEPDPIIYIKAPFNGTRLINSHTPNITGKGVLDFLISHRFGYLNEGAYNFFGLDRASTRMAFEYGISDKLMAGIGRSSEGKNFDGFVKYRLLTQTRGGSVRMPFSVTYLGGVSISSRQLRVRRQLEGKNFFADELVYTHQLIMGGKANKRISWQIMPTLIHRNYVADPNQPNDLLAMGLGFKYKITPGLHITADYVALLNRPDGSAQTNPLAFGLDLVTGGHVFQLYFTNSRGMIEKEFIGNNSGSWQKADIGFGFTICRNFVIKSEEKKAK